MIGLSTPREALAEFRRAKVRPWWADKLAAELEAHLTLATFRGVPLIDTPMTMSACEACLEEAIEAVTAPADPRQAPAILDPSGRPARDEASKICPRCGLSAKDCICWDGPPAAA